MLPICGWVGVQDSWEKVLSRKGTVYPAFQPPYRFKMLEVRQSSIRAVRPSVGSMGGTLTHCLTALRLGPTGHCHCTHGTE